MQSEKVLIIKIMHSKSIIGDSSKNNINKITAATEADSPEPLSSSFKPNLDLRTSAKSSLLHSQPGIIPIILKQGFDILRFVSPSIEQFNDDFYCKLCNSK